MKSRALFLVLMILAGVKGLPQSKDFQLRRRLAKVDSAGWFSIVLPTEIFKSVKNDFSDLRIYQFTSKDTVEAPYVLKVHQQEITEEIFHPAAFNQTKKDKSQYFTFELPKGAQVNYINLEFNDTNFDGSVTIEGSNEQREWFEIENRARIISIVNPNIDFYSGSVHFSAQSFRYLRIRIEANKTLTLKQATLKKESIKPAVETKTSLLWTTEVDKKAKQSIVNITLKDYQPIVKLGIQINERIDFYRPFRLEKLSDSTNTPKGWQYFYETISQGYLTSLDSNQFVFNYVMARKLRIVIDNSDNSPLNLKSVSVLSPKVELIARMTSGDPYLYYKNSYAHAPNYDVINFQNKIPVNAPALSLAREEKLFGEDQPSSPLIQNKLWLWLLMGVVIVVLAFFTVRMMKEK